MGMGQTPRRWGPPLNPGVGDLVKAKRRWSSPRKIEDTLRGFRGWHERGYLPHRDEPGLTQFVTFHLADSFPVALRSQWESLLEIEDGLDRRKQLEAYLDRGCGECSLRQLDCAEMVDGAFQFYHGRRCEMLAWVVMPNHVHTLFKVGCTPLSVVVSDWKKYTARQANKILRRRGHFWAEDYWDTYMRDSEHELQTRRYIENNPVKAFLVRDPKDWPWSSARFRDEHGVLRL